MTTEDDFQRALDAHPDDWQTRLVFADWLEERGDVRAEGYRALGRNHLCPYVRDVHFGIGVAWWTHTANDHVGGIDLPGDWFAFLPTPHKSDMFAPQAGLMPDDFESYPRSRAEDDAALAFAKLSTDRRAALLASAAG